MGQKGGTNADLYRGGDHLCTNNKGVQKGFIGKERTQGADIVQGKWGREGADLVQGKKALRIWT